MAEKDTTYNSKMKFDGIFNFKEFYKFCYNWLTEEESMELKEKKYSEQIYGNSKNIDIEWNCMKRFTDYFRFDAIITFKIIGLSNVEINQDGQKINTNKGKIEISVKGVLVRDYEGKFETTASLKFMRAIYEKWIITTRVEEFEDEILKSCQDFLDQAKAYLDLEAKK